MSKNLHKDVERILRYDRSLVIAANKKINEYWSKIRANLGFTKLKIMDFCGTHEWVITHYGIRTLLPREIELVAGPGCPVCVTPSHYIEELIKLALNGIVIYTYGDTYRLRTTKSVSNVFSLSEARSLGGDIRVVSDIISAIKDANKHNKPSIFVGVGFETAAPGYAQALLKSHLPSHLKLISLVKLTPPAMLYTLSALKNDSKGFPIMGIIAPGHVSTITGAKAWESVSKKCGIPVVVSGFEPLDVLVSILEILRQLVKGEAKTVVEYVRSVSWQGDARAQANIAKVFEVVDDAWRGIGLIPDSGLRIRKEFSEHDAFIEYSIRDLVAYDAKNDLSPGCRCGDVILGKIYPSQCPLFLRLCNPQRPVGPCMVSSEGTCAIWAKYGSRELLTKLADELNENFVNGGGV
ncbi:MAG: hydrogenase formation protein HypD [Desulfurococcaceae archaeon]